MDTPLRCGVIGCGVIGPAHIESLQRLERVEVAWACDLEIEKAKALAERYGIPGVTAEAEEVFADPSVDCVCICTDHASHAPLTVAALDAGKHVLCEKALAAHREGLDAMIAAHDRNPGLVFSGVFQHRFDQAVQALKRLVEEEAFGTLLTTDVQVRCLRTTDYYRADAWRGTWAEEGGAVLINQAIHFIDSLLYITGGVRSLCGAFENLTHGDTIETEDTAVAALRMRNGALGTLEATCSSHIKWEYTLSFHGDAGSLDLRNGQPLKIAFADEEKQAAVETALREAKEQKLIDAGKSYYGASHPTQVADFIDAVRTGRKPFVTARSARHAVDVVLGIYESQRTGGWTEIDSWPST